VGGGILQDLRKINIAKSEEAMTNEDTKAFNNFIDTLLWFTEKNYPKLVNKQSA
jgi:hypothetical protein